MVKKHINPFEVYTSSQRRKEKKSLDWDESAADTQSYIEGYHDADRDRPTVTLLLGVLVFCFFVLGIKLFNLQVINGAQLRALSEGNRIRNQVILAPRGIIKDRYGKPLVQNTASFNLVAVPFDLPKDGLEEEVSKLASTFGLDKNEIMSKLKKVNRASFEPVVIQQDLSPEQNILFETKVTEFIGFDIQTNPIREYMDPQVFSHILGYTGIISDKELAEHKNGNYYVNDYIGKLGIELSYENYLRGKNGEKQVEVDATGKLLRVLGENKPKTGNILELNIDKELQQLLYEKLQGKKAAAVAMNPRNGEVLALLSVPGFDNNLFAHGIKQAEYKGLLDNKDLPLFNRAITGIYPPGSTVKPMVAAAALQEGVVNENTLINDRGVLVIPNQYNPSISYNFYGWKRAGLGQMDVRSAIAQSSDIYFYTVTGGHPLSPIKGLGAEKLAEYYRKFSVGKLTGIDIQGEKPGVVADPEWKANYYKNDAVLRKWYLGDTYHIGIGQGDMLVTPLQVATWTAAIANNGTAFKPRLARKVTTEEGAQVYETKPEILIDHVVNDSVLKVVQEGMRETVVKGSGVQLNSLPITSAGKTGTSQFDGADPTRTHAWFTAYAPYENPEIVITILVEAGGEGHAAAVPVAKDALKWWAENRYKKNN